MTKLTKSDEHRREELAQSLSAKKKIVEDAISEFNEQTAALFETVKTELEKYNDVIAEANEFRDGIHGAQEEYFDEKSETWQVGDRGQAYESWKDSWSAEIEPVEIDDPAEIEAPEMDQDENFEQMPTSVE